MYADNQFLSALANKLITIAESSDDINTRSELLDLINKIVEQMEVQSK